MSNPASSRGQCSRHARPVGTASRSSCRHSRSPRRHGPGFPETALGLEVRDVADITSARVGRGAALAIAGWYVASPSTDCPPSTDVERPGYVAELGVVSDAETFCDRAGFLYGASPQELTEGAATYLDENRFKRIALPALAVTMTPGTLVPPELDVAGAAAVPAALIGRMAVPEGVCFGPDGCPPELRVDRVVWADGLARAQTTSILPRLLDLGPLLSWRPRDRLAEATVGPTGAILVETLVDPGTLAAVDPAAAALVTSTSPDAQRIWYRRALGPDPARDAALWVAIDDATGVAIGSGSIDWSSRR